MKILKKIAVIVLIALVAIQFIHPTKNLSAERTNDISKKFPYPDSVQAILKKACWDCHSNYTVYPWYSKIQPVDWWLTHHIDDGKRRLNFSEFSSYPVYRQYHKLEETVMMIDSNWMPLPSYTWIHKDAILSEGEKQTVINWALALQDSLRLNNHPDSLINPRDRNK